MSGRETSILMGVFLDELDLKFEREYRFNESRQWKADFFVRSHNLLIEIEGGTGYFLNPRGGVTKGGRHSRQKGYEDDCRKYNTAQLVGQFRVIRFTTGMVLSGEAKEFLREWLQCPLLTKN